MNTSVSAMLVAGLLLLGLAGETGVEPPDTTTPRPYNRINLVQGTRGCFVGYPDRVHIEGRSEGHGWEDLEAYREEFDHPLWKKLEAESAGAGHGGMDFLEDYRLIESLRAGTPMDSDVYDAAAISAVCELSEISVAEGSRPVAFPDFTRGAWKKREPSVIVVRLARINVSVPVAGILLFGLMAVNSGVNWSS